MYVLIIKWGKKRPDEAFLTNFSGDNRIVKLWNSGKSINEVLEEEKKLINFVDELDEITIIEYKRYCDYFGTCKSQSLFDFPLDYTDLKDGIKEIIRNKDEFGSEWQKIRADAAEVYSTLEKRGILVCGKKVNPHYSMNVYSGRSKNTGFNLQGSNGDYDISHINDKYNMLIRFDWIAADMRMASYMSKDENLINSYEKSDPYTYISECLGGKIDREKCKLELNKSVNSLVHNDLVLKIFPKLGEWIKIQKDNLESNGYAKSILGRKFYTDHTLKGNRRAFNGTLQGSVAHAMQSTISKVTNECGGIILAEQHDSLTVAAPENRLLKTIKSVSNIMLEPLKNIRMPLVVEIGRNWCKYKKYKEFR